MEWPERLTLPSLAERRAAETPDAAVLIDAASDATMSAAMLVDAFRRVARGLHAAGFRSGDCLCTLMGNDIAWYVAALAAQSLGGTVSGINPLATRGEITRQFSRLPAKAILAQPHLLATAQEVARNCNIPMLISTASPGPAQAGETGEIIVLDRLDGPPIPGEQTILPHQPAIYPFSSGSSGLPKPAIVTHRNMIAGATQIVPSLDIRKGDRLLGLAPLFHIVGPHLLPAALVANAAIVVIPRFDPSLIFDVIERHSVTQLPLLTPVLKVLARHPAGAGRNFSSLRFVGAGGAAMPPAVQREAEQRFGCTVAQVYGMTETAALISSDRIGDVVSGSVGKPAPLVGIRIRDVATAACLPAGEEGEIEVGGPMVFAGYLGQPQESAEALTEDGWLRTGDLGRVEADGRLFITGRIKEMIKVNSGQVAPAELEMLLCGHPAVADAAVIGRPNDYCGEIPVAYLVLNEPVDPFVVVDWVNEQVIRYKRIRAVHVVDALPKNAIGKIDRSILAELDRSHRSSRGEVRP